MLLADSLHPQTPEVNPVIVSPKFRFTCYHPVELVPSYRFERGGLSVAVWFSRARNVWIVRNADLGIRHQFPADLSHSTLEGRIMAGLAQVEGGQR